jgi:hypothetical protein
VSRRRFAWLGALVLVLVLAWLAGTRQVSEPGKTADEPGPRGEALPAPATGAPAATPSLASNASPTDPARLPRLPAVDAPLASSLDALVARADAGDPQAACRLAMELVRCESIQYLATVTGTFFRDLEGKLEAKGELDAADRVAAEELAKIEVARQCRVVPETLRHRAPHYLGQAARAGHPEAMVRYADSQFWPADGRGVFSDPEFDRWRRDAPGMLQRAFAAGVPEAPFILMVAYQDDFGMVGALIPDDPVKAEALRLLMVRLHGWPARPPTRTLDAKRLQQATELARQWHEGPFQGRRYRGQKRATFPHASSALPGADTRPFCSDDRRLPPASGPG